MSTRLVILGLLRDRELYGYEIKRIIGDHMGDWTSIAFGSIYFALGKLEKEKLLETAGIEKEGGRPSRKVYRITEKGRGEFLRLLREVWRKSERWLFDLDIALFFQKALSPEEITEGLERRRAELEEGLRRLVMHRDEQLSNRHVPRLAEAIFNHTQAHMEAELDWLKQTKERFAKGVYS